MYFSANLNIKTYMKHTQKKTIHEAVKMGRITNFWSTEIDKLIH